MMTPIWGPASSDPEGKIRLTTSSNPDGLAPLEWSNALARVLRSQGLSRSLRFQRRTLRGSAAVDLDEARRSEELREFRVARCGRSFRATPRSFRTTWPSPANSPRDCARPGKTIFANAPAITGRPRGPTMSMSSSTRERAQHRRQLDAEAALRLLCRRRLRRHAADHVRRSVRRLGKPVEVPDRGDGITTEPLAVERRRIRSRERRRRPSLHAHFVAADAAGSFDREFARRPSVRRRRKPVVRRRCRTCSRAYGAAIEQGGTEAIDELLRQAGLVGRPFIDDTPLSSPPLRALSLAIAQKCNLGCTYCYAQQGEFGGAAEKHGAGGRASRRRSAGGSRRTRAPASIWRSSAESRWSIARCCGPRPSAPSNWPNGRGAKITFSITTNGTLLTEDDGRFFEEHGFAVTISIDGPQEAHDALSVPSRAARGSFDAVMKRVAPLLKMQQRMQVSARVTVTPRNLVVAPDARHVHRRRLSQRRLFAYAERAQPAQVRCSPRISNSCWAK